MRKQLISFAQVIKKYHAQGGGLTPTPPLRTPLGYYTTAKT